VKHTTFQSDDLPLLPVLVDRRRAPDRRTIWRGGRRDSDWTTNRPLGALSRLEGESRAGVRLRQILSSFHLV
jgi:hypothetical protein